jgi:hypothetical protein
MKAFLAVLLLGQAAVADSATAQSLPYSRATIAEWKSEFSSMIAHNLKESMWPWLTNQDHAKIARVRFVYIDDPAAAIMGFRTDGSIVYMPVTGLLFLKDLALAEAWLHLNGYTSQTLLDYLNALRLGRHANWGTDGLPLQALGIPAQALQDQRVLDRRNETLSKGILFIVGHELGHVVQGLDAHTRCRGSATNACDYAAVRRAESRADEFAAALLGRIGLVPQSAAFLYTIFSRITRSPAEFPTLEAWQAYALEQEHPIDSQRVRSLADWMKVNAKRLVDKSRADQLVEQLDLLARSIDDRDADLWQIACAKSLDLADLQPRATLMATLRPTASEAALSGRLAGYYRGDIRFHTLEARPLEVLLVPSSDGHSLRVQTMFGGIRGSALLNIASDRRSANGTWSVGDDRYELVLESTKANDATARYALLADRRASGVWSLFRAKPTQLAGATSTHATVAQPMAAAAARPNEREPTASLVGTRQAPLPASPQPPPNAAATPAQRQASFGTRLVHALGEIAVAVDRATSRQVVVNGIPLNAQQLAEVDSLNCGDAVPNGSYWLHWPSRTWGYAGESPGRPLPNCSAATKSNQAEVPQPANADDECNGYHYSEDRINCLKQKLMH